MMFVTPFECESMLCHREKKISLNNHAFIAQQEDALGSVDNCIGAALMGLKDDAVVFAKDLEVRKFFWLNYEFSSTQ